MVMHWNTVSIARPKLSKFVMPKFGPSQFFRHSYSSGQWKPLEVLLAHGDGESVISPADATQAAGDYCKVGWSKRVHRGRASFRQRRVDSRRSGWFATVMPNRSYRRIFRACLFVCLWGIGIFPVMWRRLTPLHPSLQVLGKFGGRTSPQGQKSSQFLQLY